MFDALVDLLDRNLLNHLRYVEEFAVLAQRADVRIGRAFRLVEGAQKLSQVLAALAFQHVGVDSVLASLLDDVNDFRFKGGRVIRFTPDGRLITTGMRYEPDVNVRCFKEANCKPAFEVYEADPDSLALTILTDRIRYRSIPLPTTALRIGQDVWISSLGADRVFVFPYRP